jgi:hypothetical protein
MTKNYADMTTEMNLKCGDLVEIRTKEEVLRTLDKHGRLEELPFMPQMFKYCGKQYRVYKSAHKTCDTVTLTGGRRMKQAVHLEGLRCDGEAYGGCEAGCLIFWKEAWLKRVEATTEDQNGREVTGGSACSEADVLAGTRIPRTSDSEPVRYVCQITQLPAATTHLSMLNPEQYVEDYRSGNVNFSQIICGFIYAFYYKLTVAGIGLGGPLRWLYDRFQATRDGVPFPRRTGLVKMGTPTPSESLDLKPGERVRVKHYEEILTTLDCHNKNRGLLFDAEMVPYCGREFTVLKRVGKILDERTGSMVSMKRDCIILDGVVCQSLYTECKYCPLFCPRSIYSYWREIWLDRVDSSISSKSASECEGRRVAAIEA